MSCAILVCVGWTVLSLLATSPLGVAAEAERRAGKAPEVTILQGVVTGRTDTSLRGRTFFSYKGIPYAKPPLGDLRFKAPQPVEAGNGTISGTLDGLPCVQKVDLGKSSLFGSEDCLSVNVYTPQVGDARLPVMVWIHGGAWFAGTGASLMTGPDYMLDKDIVLVSLNYRLGALGFLSTGDAASPGNYGMKDQVAALRWVRDNVAAFGGNPDSVTLFGQSAGAASVHMHMFSDMSTGLFHRAISESGSALSTWASIPPEPLAMAKEQAAFFGCPIDDTQQLVDCLRQVDSHALIDSGDMFHFWSTDPLTTYVPVVEDAESEEPFLTRTPFDMLREGQFNRVPWICGVVAQEGILRGLPIISHPGLLSDLNSNWTTLGPRLLEIWKSIDDPAVLDDMWQNITTFYFNNQLPVTADNGLGLIDLFSDRFFIHGVHKSALLQAGHGHDSIYMYNFNYKGEYSYSGLFGSSEVDYGICHSDDLIYLFKPMVGGPEWSVHHPDLKMVDSLVTLWTNFATYGAPTPPGDITSDHVTCDINSVTTDDRCDLSQLSWSPVPTAPSPGQSELHTSFLNIYVNSTGDTSTLDFAMETDMYKERMAFWDSSNLKENIV